MVNDPLAEGEPELAPPCAVCGTRAGPSRWPKVPHQRLSGRRFRVDGMLCVTCYYRLQHRHYRGTRRTDPAARVPVTRQPPIPCAVCGTSGGSRFPD
jgi:hypothetical protein